MGADEARDSMNADVDLLPYDTRQYDAHTMTIPYDARIHR